VSLMVIFAPCCTNTLTMFGLLALVARCSGVDKSLSFRFILHLQEVEQVVTDIMAAYSLVDSR